MSKKVKKIIIFIVIIILLISIINSLKTIILKQIYPIKYWDTVKQYANEYNVDPLLILSIIKAESNFKEDVVSSQKAIGLMQIMEETAKEISKKLEIEYKENTLFNPKENIQLGTKYISELLEKYNQNYLLAVAAYNAGIGNVSKWIDNGTIKEDGSNIEKIPFKETNTYVRKIIRNYRIYQELYE